MFTTIKFRAVVEGHCVLKVIADCSTNDPSTLSHYLSVIISTTRAPQVDRWGSGGFCLIVIPYFQTRNIDIDMIKSQANHTVRDPNKDSVVYWPRCIFMKCEMDKIGYSVL